MTANEVAAFLEEGKVNTIYIAEDLNHLQIINKGTKVLMVSYLHGFYLLVNPGEESPYIPRDWKPYLKVQAIEAVE